MRYEEFYNSLKEGEELLEITTGKIYIFHEIDEDGDILVEDENGMGSYYPIKDDVVRYFYRLDEHPKVTIETQQVTHRREELKFYKLYNKKTCLVEHGIVFDKYDTANSYKSSDHEVIEFTGVVDTPVKSLRTTIQQY